MSTSVNIFRNTHSSYSSGGGKEEQTKSVTITENGTTTVTPDEGKVLSSVEVNTEVPVKEEQTKSITIHENGTTTVTPDEGKTLTEVSVTTDVPQQIANAVFKANEQGAWVQVSVTWNTDHYECDPATTQGFIVVLTTDGNEPDATFSNANGFFQWTSGSSFGINAVVPFTSTTNGDAPIYISL